MNELAPELSFPDSMTRTRRDHIKFLTLIRTIAFLHQWQREVKTARHGDKPFEYIETTEQDVELAKKIIHEVLGRSLDEHARANAQAAAVDRRHGHCGL